MSCRYHHLFLVCCNYTGSTICIVSHGNRLKPISVRMKRKLIWSNYFIIIHIWYYWKVTNYIRFILNSYVSCLLCRISDFFYSSKSRPFSALILENLFFYILTYFETFLNYLTFWNVRLSATGYKKWNISHQMMKTVFCHSLWRIQNHCNTELFELCTP